MPDTSRESVNDLESCAALNRRLLPAQSSLFLAEIDWDANEAVLDVTLAGAPGVRVFEWEAPRALIWALESIDPGLPPSRLAMPVDMDLTNPLEFSADELVEARVRRLSGEEVNDILSASRLQVIHGDAAALREGQPVHELRWEGYTLEPKRTDLHLLVVGPPFTLHGENGEISLDGLEEPPHHDDPPSGPVLSPLQAPAFPDATSDLPDDIERCLRRFFTAQLTSDWEELARVFPHPDFDLPNTVHWHACHYRRLFDFFHGESIEDVWVENDLASVQVRGTLSSHAEDDLPPMTEVSLWTFSLRRRANGDWIVRHFSQSFLRPR